MTCPAETILRQEDWRLIVQTLNEDSARLTIASDCSVALAGGLSSHIRELAVGSTLHVSHFVRMRYSNYFVVGVCKVAAE